MGVCLVCWRWNKTNKAEVGLVQRKTVAVFREGRGTASH